MQCSYKGPSILKDCINPQKPELNLLLFSYSLIGKWIQVLMQDLPKILLHHFPYFYLLSHVDFLLLLKLSVFQLCTHCGWSYFFCSFLRLCNGSLLILLSCVFHPFFFHFSGGSHIANRQAEKVSLSAVTDSSPSLGIPKCSSTNC